MTRLYDVWLKVDVERALAKSLFSNDGKAVLDRVVAVDAVASFAARQRVCKRVGCVRAGITLGGRVNEG